MIASNPYAIGYISLGTVDKSVHTLAINDVQPSVGNVKNGTYKVARPFLVLYREGQTSKETQQFLDWMTSEGAKGRVDNKA